MLKTSNHAGVESYIIKNIRNQVEFSMKVRLKKQKQGDLPTSHHRPLYLTLVSISEVTHELLIPFSRLIRVNSPPAVERR